MQTVGELFTKAMINRQAVSDANRWGIIYQGHDQPTNDANRWGIINQGHDQTSKLILMQTVGELFTKQAVSDANRWGVGFVLPRQ